MFVRLWLPPILWIAVIFSASTDTFSATQTAPWLATVINAIAGHPVSPDTFEIVQFAVRKTAHLGEYGILAALLFRALRADRVNRWTLAWSLTAVAIAILVAITDEWHQSFVPSRTASPWDVLVDTIGAILAQVLFFKR